MQDENAIQQFTNETLGFTVRVIDRDGEPWFVAKDVCLAFGDTNYRRSVLRLDDDEKGVSPLSTPGGTQEMVIVSESGLYSLLFHMQPQDRASLPVGVFEKRTAQLSAFKRWITHEVLPSIRKHGEYVPRRLREVTVDANALIELVDRLKLAEERLDFFKPKTPFGTISQVNGLPRTKPVPGYFRTTKTTTTVTEVTEYQKRLFDLP